MRALLYLKITFVIGILVVGYFLILEALELNKNMQDWKQEVELYNLK